MKRVPKRNVNKETEDTVRMVNQALEELEGEGKLEEMSGKIMLTEKGKRELNIAKGEEERIRDLVGRFPCTTCEHINTPVYQEPCLTCPKIRGAA